MNLENLAMNSFFLFLDIFNNDLSTFQTKVNGYFTIEYVKDIWFKGQVESNGYSENSDYMINFMIPNMIEELRLNFKEIVNTFSCYFSNIIYLA